MQDNHGEGVEQIVRDNEQRAFDNAMRTQSTRAQVDAYRDTGIATNVAANGRWGTLGMAAIALHQDFAFVAFGFVLALFLAYVTEQIPRHWAGRKTLFLVTVGLTIGNLISLLVLMLWR